MENWMITVAIVAGTALMAYGTFRGAFNAKMDNLTKKLDAHIRDDMEFHKEVNNRMNAQFKRIDNSSERIVTLEQQKGNYLCLDTAEEKFVQKTELSLHLEKIYIKLNHIDKNDERMVGKLDDLTKAFTDYMLEKKDD